MMKIFNKILFVLIFLLPTISFSQSIGRFVFSSAAGFYSQNICIDFSVGQTIAGVYENNKIFTSGFEQPAELTLSKNIRKDIINIDFNITIFPNPVSDFVNIYITSKYKIEELKIEIFSVQGKEIPVGSMFYDSENFSKIQVDLSKLNQGNYILKTYINNSFAGSFVLAKL